MAQWCAKGTMYVRAQEGSKLVIIWALRFERTGDPYQPASGLPSPLGFYIYFRILDNFWKLLKFYGTLFSLSD